MCEPGRTCYPTCLGSSKLGFLAISVGYNLLASLLCFSEGTMKRTQYLEVREKLLTHSVPAQTLAWPLRPRCRSPSAENNPCKNLPFAEPQSLLPPQAEDSSHDGELFLTTHDSISWGAGNYSTEWVETIRILQLGDERRIILGYQLENITGE